MPRAALPIDEILPRLTASLRNHPNIALIAPTGAGKTTRVPPAIRDAIPKGRVIMLEPRRIAARAAARRIAEEQGTRVGEEVGYAVRFDARYSAATRILVVTDGVFLRMLQDDPFLENTSAVLFDEFHERGINSDLALSLVRSLQCDARPDLHILAMSATLDTEPVARFLGDCPIIESKGRLFPVTVEYRGGGPIDLRTLPSQIKQSVESLLPRTEGDILVFLPGVGEIHRTHDALEHVAHEHDVETLLLYGDLPPEKQDAVFRPSNRRRVILATNVAETSITVPNITGVIDSGLARIMRYDPSVGLDRLELSRISTASADQRTGRAGRTAPGLCVRLWSLREQQHAAAREEPEIRRVDLAGPALELHCWGETNIRKFAWFEPPPEFAVERAETLLLGLGAIDAAGVVTERGKRLAKLPVHPRLARLLEAGAELGCLDLASLAAALLSERDPFYTAGGRTKAMHVSESDVVDRVHTLEQLLETNNVDLHVGEINRSAVKHIHFSSKQLRESARQVFDSKFTSSDRDSALRQSFLAAFPDRLARRREKSSPRGIMVGGRGVVLHEASAVSEAELFLCIEIAAGNSEDSVRIASAVERDWLPAENIKIVEAARFDERTERAIIKRQTLWFDLVLDEAILSGGDEELLANCLVDSAKNRLASALDLSRDEVTSFRNRIAFLREWMPELELPTFDDEHLAELLPTLCAGKRSFAELRKLPIVDVLKGSMTFSQLQSLDRDAPEKLEVPSGSKIAVQYEPGKPPVLAVRIQEVFGLADTPRLAGGRVPVLLHLLAPNFRPQQVTQDLRSFWNTTYQTVRKELRARYPKHAWPEDPWTAPAQRGAKRRQN